MDVQLKERWYEQPTIVGEPIKKRIEQDEVWVNGVMVGYVGTQLGAPLTLFAELAESTLIAVREAIDKRDNTPTPDRRTVVCVAVGNMPPAGKRGRR